MLLCALVLLASEGLAGAKEQTGGRGPVVITSKTLSADNSANTALFEGSVVAKSEDMTLYADRMLVFYTQGGEIMKIEAEGNVKLIRDKRAVTSEKAEYLTAEQKITFTGNPMALEGPNVITGTRMTYLIDEDRSVVENSKVILEQKPAGGQKN